MNARLMAASMSGGFALGALLFSGSFSGQIAAQTGAAGQGNSGGLFSTLTVGRQVEFTTDQYGLAIKTYDDDEFKFAMQHKIKEIGNDYIVLEFDDKNGTGAISEFRLPVYRFSQVFHLGKADPRKKPAAVAPNAADIKKPATPDKKPTTKKKN